MNAVNCAGFLVVLLGVILYKIIFHLKKMERKYCDDGRDEGTMMNTNYRHVHSSLSGCDGGDDSNVASGKSGASERGLLMAEAVELFDDDFTGDKKRGMQASRLLHHQPSSEGLELPVGKSQMSLGNNKAKYSHVQSLGDDFEDEQKSIPSIV